MFWCWPDYAALLLTAVASIFYLIQERRLKAKRTGTLLEKLPPLATLDNLISISMGLGFVLLTLGVIFAVTWASVESGTRWVSDCENPVFLFHLGAVPGDDLSAHFRGLAREKSGGDGA